MRALKLKISQLNRLPKNCKERRMVCWYVRFDNPDNVEEIYRENLSAMDQLDPSQLLFGIFSFP